MDKQHPFKSLIVAAALLLAPSPLFAKSIEKRVEELELKIDQMQKTYLQNNQDVASIVVRSEELQRDMQGLKGGIESAQVMNERATKEFHKHFHDIDIRLRTLEERMHVLLVQTTAALQKISPALANEAELYQKGLDALQSGSYVEATAAFQQFLKKYPKSQFAPMASLSIADAYFGLRDHQRAIKSYQSFIKQNANHEQVKRAILKQGEAFYELGLLEEAKAFLSKVTKDYAGTPEASQAAEKLERIEQHTTKSPPAASAPPPGNAYPETTIQEERQKSLEF